MSDIRRLSDDLHELIAKMYVSLGEKICESRKDVTNVGSVGIRSRTKEAGAEEFSLIDRVGKREGDGRLSCASASSQPIDLVLVIVVDPMIDLVENVQTCPR